MPGLSSSLLTFFESILVLGFRGFVGVRSGRPNTAKSPVFVQVLACVRALAHWCQNPGLRCACRCVFRRYPAQDVFLCGFTRWKVLWNGLSFLAFLFVLDDLGLDFCM